MRKLVFLALVVIAASSVNASYLYWAVGDDGKGGNDDLSKVVSYAGKLEYTWDTAKFYEVNAGGDKTLLDSMVNLDGEVANPGIAGPSTVNLGDVSTKTGYSYYIELVSSAHNNELVGYTQGTYASIGTQYLTDALPETLPAAVIWHGGTYSAPEPTSAMLILLGVAGLALRRKQRKIA